VLSVWWIAVQGSELERLLKILESSEDRDEKLEALSRIDEIAKTRTDIWYNIC